MAPMIDSIRLSREQELTENDILQQLRQFHEMDSGMPRESPYFYVPTNFL
jgi:hypothetical protein